MCSKIVTVLIMCSKIVTVLGAVEKNVCFVGLSILYISVKSTWYDVSISFEISENRFKHMSRF